MKPVLLVTGHAPPDRIAPFAALNEREGIEVALFGGRLRHGATGGGELENEGTVPSFSPGGGELAVPHRHVEQSEIGKLAASGRYRAVVCGTGGRRALPAAYRGARRAGVPFVLWASLWAHPRTPGHALSLAPTRWLYAHADAVATYGEHVSAYVLRHGARNVHVAPQAVDPAFWAARTGDPRRERDFQVLFVGRPDPEKGAHVLLEAWPDAVMVGDPPVGPLEVRNFLAGSDVLVMPSLRTRSFREPWGLIANEAMHQGTPVIASTEVGAAAGGLVRHERNGLVVEAGDARALRRAIERLRSDPGLRQTLGSNALRDVSAYTPQAWAAGVSAALTSAGAVSAAR